MEVDLWLSCGTEKDTPGQLDARSNLPDCVNGMVTVRSTWLTASTLDVDVLGADDTPARQLSRRHKANQSTNMHACEQEMVCVASAVVSVL